MGLFGYLGDLGDLGRNGPEQSIESRARVN